MLKFLLLVNKQGQIRLSQYYTQVTREERFVLEGQLIRKCLLKGKNQCPFMEFNGYKVSEFPWLVWLWLYIHTLLASLG